MNLNYKITSHTVSYERNQLFRSGSMYQLLLFSKGNCQVLFHRDNAAEKLEYLCSTSELVLMKPGETLVLQNPSENENCHFLLFRFSEDTLENLSDDSFSFPEKFSFVPYRVAIIHSEARQCALLMNLLTRINDPDPEGISLGQDLYVKSLLTSFLILFLRACVQNDQVHRSHIKKELLIDDVFRYINHHLSEDLSLSVLEKEFFVSGEHLSRKFHKEAGISLHSYINRSRIDLSKKFLLQGYCVKDLYTQCGFDSYNHFFRVFKKETGTTPKKYQKSQKYAIIRPLSQD